VGADDVACRTRPGAAAAPGSGPGLAVHRQRPRWGRSGARATHALGV